MQSRALWFLGNNCFSIREEPLPKLKKDGCMIKTTFSGISSGTEKLVYSESVPQTMWESMKCPYMGGTFPFPVKYGYSLTGEIVDGPQHLIGKNAHLLHPHQNYCCVPTADIFLMDDEVPKARATLASNMETAVNAVWDSGLTLGDRVLVVGFGCLGSLVARLLNFMIGVDIVVTDISHSRLAWAESLGFDTCLPNKVPENFDIAFNVSADQTGLQTAIDSVGFEGLIVELSWYGNNRTSLMLGESFHNLRKRIISSQVSQISPQQRCRWDNNRRKQLVFKLLKRPEFDLHISESVFFEDLPGILKQSNNENSGRPINLVRYSP